MQVLQGVRSLFFALLGTALAVPAAQALEPDQLPQGALVGKVHASGNRAPNANTTFGGNLAGYDSIANFTGTFTAPGIDAFGNPTNSWPYAMVGHSPRAGDTTVIRAPIIPVTVDLRNADGTPRYVNGQRLISSPRRLVDPVVNSPLFGFHAYNSSNRPTQFTDALMRTNFGTQMDEDWHTLLDPAVMPGQTITLLAGSYYFSLNADGSCCLYILADETAFGNTLFPPTYPVDNSTVLGAAELSGQARTKDLTTLLFNNVFLYENGDPTQCCVIGYHSFDAEPGTTANGGLPRFYVMAYASWVSPGIFSDPTFGDVAALSHEYSETFNDPFVMFDGVHNSTPWWLSPNGQCDDILEVGDVIEGLPNAQVSINAHGMTYHLQNETLLSWFGLEQPWQTRGAFSFPDPTVLTAPTAPQNPNCAP
jgi:hypothetical protein